MPPLLLSHVGSAAASTHAWDVGVRDRDRDPAAAASRRTLDQFMGAHGVAASGGICVSIDFNLRFAFISLTDGAHPHPGL